MKTDYPQAVELLQQCHRLFNEALPKFNLGASFLDANAIELLNSVPSRVAVFVTLAQIDAEDKQAAEQAEAERDEVRRIVQALEARS